MRSGIGNTFDKNLDAPGREGIRGINSRLNQLIYKGFACPLLTGNAIQMAIEPDAASAETLAVTADMVPSSKNHYVLRVRGDSMIEDQICDGDMVVIEGRNEARNGETVVALVDGAEATLKRFYRDGAEVKLVPANSTMDPMIFHAANVEIRGVVRGLIRQF